MTLYLNLRNKNKSNLKFGLLIFLIITVFFLPSAVKAEGSCAGNTSLAADPVAPPAGGGRGKTRIFWKAPDGCNAGLYFIDENKKLTLVALGNPGETQIEWIFPDRNIDFGLYEVKNQETPLATIQITPTHEISYTSDLYILYDKVLYRWIIPVLTVLVMFCGFFYLYRQQKYPKLRTWFTIGALMLPLVWTTYFIITAPFKPIAEQPNPDASEAADIAWQLSKGNGYVTYIYNNEPKPPKSPIGFSVSLVPYVYLANDPNAVAIASKVNALLYFFLAVALAWAIGGRLAATLVAFFIGSSPFAESYATFILPDVYTTALIVLIALLLYKPNSWRVCLAGAISGFLVITRLQMIICLPAILLALPTFRLRIYAFASAMPFFLANALINLMTFGGIFKTGYDYWMPGARNFGLDYAVRGYTQGDGPWVFEDWFHGLLVRWVCPCTAGGPMAYLPNIFYYPLIILGFFWVFAPPFVTLYGLWMTWKERHQTTAKFTIAILAFGMILFTTYFYQATRFMTPIATLLTIYAGVGLAEKLRYFIFVKYSSLSETSGNSGFPDMSSAG